MDTKLWQEAAITLRTCIVICLVAFSTGCFAAGSEGEFISDTASGCSVWNPEPAPQETISYDGGCAKGLAEGQGTLVWYVQSIEVWIYLGHFEAGRFSGQGKLTVSDGTVVEGYWKNHQITHGFSASPDGRKREGFFKNGRLTGLGRYVSEDGSVYEGTFVNGLLEGVGELTYPDGTLVTGTFVRGQLAQP